MPHCNMQCCNCERKRLAAPSVQVGGVSGAAMPNGNAKHQWMMIAAPSSEKLPIRLMAEAPRKMKSNLGRLAVHVCVCLGAGTRDLSKRRFLLALYSGVSPQTESGCRDAVKIGPAHARQGGEALVQITPEGIFTMKMREIAGASFPARALHDWLVDP